MTKYKERQIKFKELVQVQDWHLKMYTICKEGDFHHQEYYQSVKENLPSWLLEDNDFDASHDQIGFVISHVGTEGIFTLVNWWVGKNMLNTNIFITKHDDHRSFTKVSGKGLAPCIWELEVINHERLSWVANMLKPDIPDAASYLQDVTNVIL